MEGANATAAPSIFFPGYSPSDALIIEISPSPGGCGH